MRSGGAGASRGMPNPAARANTPERPFAAPLLFSRVLLFPQVCLLACIAGILTLRQPAPGLTMLVLVWFLDLPRALPPAQSAQPPATATSILARVLTHALVLLLAFVSAYAYTVWRTPARPPAPAWLMRAAFASLDEKGVSRLPPPQAIQARVESNTLLPGNRQRVLLADILPLASSLPPGLPPVPPYQGRVVWFLRDMEQVLLPGQHVKALLRFAPVHGLSNPGRSNWNNHWHDRNVWFRAWSGQKTRAETFSPIDEKKEAGGYAAKDRLALLVQQNLFTLVNTRETLRKQFLSALPTTHTKDGTLAPTQAGAILLALIFGDRSHIGQAEAALFARATLAHSLALSGMHLGFAVLAGYILAHYLGRLVPTLWLHVARPRAALLLALPPAALYLWLGQAPISLLRATCMLFFWVLLSFLRRPRVLLDGLCTAVAFLLLANPLALFTPAMQMSALSVATIALTLPTLNRMAARLFPQKQPNSMPGFAQKEKPRPACRLTKALRAAFLMLGLSFCIQIVLLPLTLRLFGSSGLLFPLNLLWLPVLGLAVLPLAFVGLLSLCLGLASLATLFLQTAALPCNALIFLLTALDQSGLLFSPLMPRPHWMSVAGFWLLCLVLPGIVVRPYAARARGAALALTGIALLLYPLGQTLYLNTRPKVTLRLLDVGQGQAVLLEWRGLGGGSPSGRVLIDGGGGASPGFDVGEAVVAPTLTDNALPRLTLLINTHPDADHLEGLLFILNRFTVSRYLSNGGTPAPILAARENAILAQKGLRRERICAGDRLLLAPGLVLETVWPPGRGQKKGAPPPRHETSNNLSLVLRLVWQKKGLALLCGDAEKPALKKLTTTGQPLLQAEVLVLPHHGSAASLEPALYDRVRPRLALVSNGFGNRWGLPSEKVVSTLFLKNIQLYSTAKAGCISLSWRTPTAPPVLKTAVPGARPERPLPGALARLWKR